jgi:hypothetical protein
MFYLSKTINFNMSYLKGEKVMHNAAFSTVDQRQLTLGQGLKADIPTYCAHQNVPGPGRKF